MTTTTGNGAERVTIDDIRSKFAELSAEVDTGVSTARNTTAIAAVAGVVVLVVAAYLIGRRGGSRRETILEIRRV